MTFLKTEFFFLVKIHIYSQYRVGTFVQSPIRAYNIPTPKAKHAIPFCRLTMRMESAYNATFTALERFLSHFRPHK